jgi:hypothetical protein
MGRQGVKEKHPDPDLDLVISMTKIAKIIKSRHPVEKRGPDPP